METYIKDIKKENDDGNQQGSKIGELNDKMGQIIYFLLYILNFYFLK